jgi:2-polyprenyl-6-methoxyphenol hydroxylase-like FAD-dependent oxidoreductase
MEDACVLAELLHSSATVESALSDYVSRRKPSVQWVRQQSMAVAESLRMTPAIRNATLRERGRQMMQSRFGPLVPAPLSVRVSAATSYLLVVASQEWSGRYQSLALMILRRVLFPFSSGRRVADCPDSDFPGWH